MSYIFEEEEIKVIKEFPNYGISNLGYVYRDLRYGLLPENYRKKRLKGYRDKKGYIKVHLSDGKKHKVFFVHRLVAEYFVPNPEGYRYVKHIDGNRENNRADNLRWTPYLKGNRIDRSKHLDILKLREEGLSIKEISGKTGISYSTVANILSDFSQITIRIPAELKERLKVEAERNGKSVTEFIIQILEKELEDGR
ncbi:MAG TPA: ribbon-helix-helix protein, CopG family [Persephonella sp.]|uniref:HNH endonuclease n=1 Tax=Persephonella marina (strain DSM 14350 / EX-H1) TaxID=123214 RepID=C0QRT1_PERMH|nr:MULTISPECIES: HNH endonuclease [Persephonella]ACO04940.1 HNH endonuclease [Persephonella marina EX-H1]HCB69122.1 ribbon-helix-helix protein, CopG family [Persephonella sp.]